MQNNQYYMSQNYMWFVIQKNDHETYFIQTYTEKMGC